MARAATIVVQVAGDAITVGRIDADRPTATEIGVLLRCRLDARRLGWHVSVSGATAAIEQLLELFGLSGSLVPPLIDQASMRSGSPNRANASG